MADPFQLPSLDTTPQVQEPPATPNPLGLTYDQTSALRDRGHISGELFDKIYPSAPQPEPAPASPALPPEASKEIYKQVKSDEAAPNLGITDPKELAKFNKFTADGGVAAAAKSQYENDANAKAQEAKWNAERWSMPNFGEQVSGTPGQPGDIRTAEMRPGDNPNVKLATDVQIKGDPMPTMEELFKQYGPNMSGYDMMAQGIKMAAQSGAAKGAEESAMLGRMANEDKARIQQQEADNAYAQSHLNDQLTKMQTAADRVGSMQVDTHRLFKDKSTGDKIGLGIAMFLGALGKGGNKAVDVMNNAIDRDIKAQQADIANAKDSYNAQQGVYGDMLNMFKNKEAATQATRVAYLNNMQIRVQQIAAKYGGQDAQAKATQLLGEIEQKKNDALMQFKQQVMANMPVNPMGDANNLAPEKRERFVPGYGLALTKEDAKDVRQYVTDHDNAKTGIDRLLKIADTPGASANKALRDEAQSLSLLLQGSLRTQVLGPGTVNDGERAMLQNLISDPTTFFSLSNSNKTRLRTLLKQLDTNLDNRLKSSGLKSLPQSLGIASR